MAQRERYVASGRALLRVAVYVRGTRRQSSMSSNGAGARVWRHAHDAGLRLECGRGLQAEWYRSLTYRVGRAGEKTWTHWATSAISTSYDCPPTTRVPGSRVRASASRQYGSSFVLDVFDAYARAWCPTPTSSSRAPSVPARAPLSKCNSSARCSVVDEPW